MKKMVDERWKTQMAREFVTRNQERLWMFDRAYMGQTPRAVCDDIVGRLNYMSTMKMFNKIENKLDRGYDSFQVGSCLQEDSGSTPPKERIRGDPNISTLTTSRSQRYERMSKLLAPATLASAQDNNLRRGGLHDRGFGNFSRYSAHLKMQI
jgi:hypothetical protein